jgi:hypothetical protein
MTSQVFDHCCCWAVGSMKLIVARSSFCKIQLFNPCIVDKPRGASPRRHLCTFRILIPYYFVPYIMPLCHSAIPPFHHSAIPPFRHSAILPFRHSTIPPSHHSAIPLFRHSAIPPFRHSAIPPFRHSPIPPFRHSTIPPFCSNTQ